MDASGLSPSPQRRLEESISSSRCSDTKNEGVLLLLHKVIHSISGSEVSPGYHRSGCRGLPGGDICPEWSFIPRKVSRSTPLSRGHVPRQGLHRDHHFPLERLEKSERKLRTRAFETLQ